MKVGAALSTVPGGRQAALEATLRAAEALRGERPALAVVFASPHHFGVAESVVDAVHEAVGPDRLLGCVAEAVVGEGREVEESPAVSVWLAAMREPPTTFHVSFQAMTGGGQFSGWPEGDEPGSYLLLADPFTFPAEPFLGALRERSSGTVVMGGMASGGAGPGGTRLFRDREVHEIGAVGCRLPVEVVPLVSQGCRPVGRPYTVTRAEGNVIFELAGAPAVDRIRETYASLARPDRELMQLGLHIGRVIDEYRHEFGQGDFLIRGVIGADRDNGAIAVGDRIEVGETVQFHVRDAASADEDLRTLLDRGVRALSGRRPTGALLFTCNGRGSRLFGEPDHDAALVAARLGVPTAGFFAAGEIGPVGNRNFLHGFTASLAVFTEDGGPAQGE